MCHQCGQRPAAGFGLCLPCRRGDVQPLPAPGTDARLEADWWAHRPPLGPVDWGRLLTAYDFWHPEDRPIAGEEAA